MSKDMIVKSPLCSTDSCKTKWKIDVDKDAKGIEHVTIHLMNSIGKTFVLKALASNIESFVHYDAEPTDNNPN